MTGELRDRMEYCFGTRLADVRLHSSRESGAANHHLGSLAFAVDGHICFRPGFDESCELDFPAVLAHEMAHVVQKRLRSYDTTRQRVPRLLLEQEANWAVEQALRGERVSRLTPDAWHGPRCWDIEGHYYTVLWVSLAAGLSLDDAKKNAFYAQLPDQVQELDAVAACLQWAYDRNEELKIENEYHRVQGDMANGWAEAHKICYPFVNQEFDLVSRFVAFEGDRQVQWQIQTGLHALTGGDSNKETDYREEKLNSVPGASLEYGLGLHAFGDSFAHRENKVRMYKAPLGHGSGGHAPDTIDENRAELYLSYGSRLWRLLKAKWRTVKTTPSQDDVPADVLDGLKWIPTLKAQEEEVRVPLVGVFKRTKETQSSVQIKAILDLAASALAKGTALTHKAAAERLEGIYRPENAPIHPVLPMLALPQTWSEFFHDNNGNNGVPIDWGFLERARKCAREWTGTTKGFKFHTFSHYSKATIDKVHKSPSVLGICQ